jgi:RNA polymerase sigma-70 factor (ECF subfamily)
MAETYRYSLLQSFAEHRQALMRFLTRRLGNPALAEDFAHETWLRLAHGAGGAVVGNPRSYLFRVAASVATDHQREATAGTVPVGVSPLPSNVVLYCSEFARLVRVIEDLPARCREVFLLCRFEGLSHADIAERLGIGLDTVVSHMVVAMAATEREMDLPR